MDKSYLDHRFGMEFEFSGIPRHKAADILYMRFQNEVTQRSGSRPDRTNYRIKDHQRRTWRVKFDSSIEAQRLASDGTLQPASELYKVELITPPLRYTEDHELLFDIIRDMIDEGAFVNSSCGIHIHLDGRDYTAHDIKNFSNIIASRTELFAMALQIDPKRRDEYCSDLEPSFLKTINSVRTPSMHRIEKAWYSEFDSEFSREEHYHPSRYQFLNLHCLFNGNRTIELRCFNGSLDIDRINTYILFALGLNYLAKTMRYTWLKAVSLDNPRYTMVHFLQRIGLKGQECAKCRELLTRHLPGNPNWRR